MNTKNRCKKYRKRILEISQQVQALHIGSAYSCTEIVDCIYNELMKKNDIFVMSKGHGCMIQYVILEDKKILKKKHLDEYCKNGGILGCHPDYGNPGIEASTGSLGHGFPMSLGIAYAEKLKKSKNKIYCVLSDGELQEGSTWESIMLATSLKLNNLIIFIDNNNFQSLGQTNITHPSFYPLKDKFISFGWDTFNVDGHNSQEIINSIKNRNKKKPTVIIAKTIKGKGISYMENIPIWHYRSPNKEEYKLGIKELNK